MESAKASTSPSVPTLLINPLLPIAVVTSIVIDSGTHSAGKKLAKSVRVASVATLADTVFFLI